MNSTIKKSPEILAPAGDFDSAIVAAEAGADAVYFGLSDFNARRRAKNIKYEELPLLVNELHNRNVKAYLAINTDISQRELAEAARAFALAKIANVDAFIIKDLSFLEFRNYLGDACFHLSTQCGISSSAGANFAKEIGAKRVILARELSREEIKSIVNTETIELEIFIQGAMCFSISGRCLLSSWIGGRSGNRGLCASPCRMEWINLKNGISGRIMSMKDLSLLKHIKEISKFGLLSLKIEGRLKSPEWIANAVKTVKKFRDEELIASEQKSELGDYAGRELTDFFYLGKYENLTCDSGRKKNESDSTIYKEQAQNDSLKICIRGLNSNKLEIKFTLTSLERNKDFDENLILKIKTRNEIQDVSSKELLSRYLIEKFPILNIFIETEKIKFSPRHSDLEKIESKIRALIARAKKPSRDIAKIELPNQLITAIKAEKHVCEFRKTKFGFSFARISSSQVALFKNTTFDFKFVVECNDTDDAKFADESLNSAFVVALPQVFYEANIEKIKSLISYCTERKIQIEANNLDALSLFDKNSVKWSAGPGLMILNSFAANFIKKLCAISATASLEADRLKLEELLRTTPLPIVVYVFGRPTLMRSRAKITKNTIHIAERRGLRLLVENEAEFTTVYPEKPFRFDLTEQANAIFAIDLVHSICPQEEIFSWGKVPATDFNFSGKLK